MTLECIQIINSAHTHTSMSSKVYKHISNNIMTCSVYNISSFMTLQNRLDRPPEQRVHAATPKKLEIKPFIVVIVVSMERLVNHSDFLKLLHTVLKVSCYVACELTQRRNKYASVSLMHYNCFPHENDFTKREKKY